MQPPGRAIILLGLPDVRFDVRAAGGRGLGHIPPQPGRQRRLADDPPERTPPAAPDRGQRLEPGRAGARSLAGRYFSDELETFYAVAIEGGGLEVRHRRIADGIALTPGSERDLFTAGFPIAEVWFIRDASGEVTGVEVSNGRTRGVRFERVTTP
ncbi:MAG TPA: hypothetical protein VM778_02540 [Gemmatimonadota bacterium]|nr:hypothetical protein [Gemmatimonadota bacterium]